MPVGFLSGLGRRVLVESTRPGKAKRRAASKRARVARKRNRGTS